MAASVDGIGTSSLKSVPQEVLERIAFFAATQSLVGPPSGLPPLLQTCRHIYQTLSFEANPCLYACIFSYKFDTKSVFRRLGAHINTPPVLAKELKKRWMHLKLIKARTGSRIRQSEPHLPYQTLADMLWLAYLMMLENDGKNEQQLLEYAEMDAWLMEYWFDNDGESLALDQMDQHAWPIENKENALAMCLLWFLLRPGVILRNITRFPHMMTVMKLIALAANRYPISHPSWTEFIPRSEVMLPSRVMTHFSETYRMYPPTLAPAAILVFLTLALQILSPRQAHRASGLSLQFPASLLLSTRRSEDWDTDWQRCTNLGRLDPRRTLSETYTLGSMEGVWEGVFTYTEFDGYSMLLSGVMPSVLKNCLVAHHRQTWKLREYYLVEQPELGGPDLSRPVGSGDPLKAYFPTGTRLQELSDAVEIREPGREAVRYRHASHPRAGGHTTGIVDVIILGEGHSAWGQFNLYGRVRPLDGLMSFSKEYVEGDRGRWLYRGYLVGNVNGHISGRWRDTLSPTDVAGYEGCFVMSRRR